MNKVSRIMQGVMVLVLVGLHIISFSVVIVNAADDDVKYTANSIQIIPKVKNDEAIKQANKVLRGPDSRHKFWDQYNNIANSKSFDPSQEGGLNNQLSSGIMTRDTLIAYSTVIIEFISNLGLVVGAGFIIYSGYQYALGGLGGEEGKPKAIKNAFIGIGIITTSYGIFRLLARIFIE